MDSRVEPGRRKPFLANWTGIVVLGPEGLAWQEHRVGLDGLQVEATSPHLLCRVNNLEGGTDEVRLDPTTGRRL